MPRDQVRIGELRRLIKTCFLVQLFADVVDAAEFNRPQID